MAPCTVNCILIAVTVVAVSDYENTIYLIFNLICFKTSFLFIRFNTSIVFPEFRNNSVK